jgi:uncharacterized protein (TIGR03067 family)
VKALILVAFGLIGTVGNALRGDEPKKDTAPALIRSARSGPWSAPDTWEGGKLPGAGARVQVRAGHTVTYDLSSDQVMRSIHVAGTLTFARDRDTRLDVGLIKIQSGDNASEDGFNCEAHLQKPDPQIPRPAMEVGTAEEPIPAEHTAFIRLVAIEGMDKESCPAIVCCGGRLDLHGAPLSRTWVKLGATVNAARFGKGQILPAPGDVAITLTEPVTGWRVGDRIIVTTTTSRARVNQRQTLRPGPGIEPAYTEERTIKAINRDHLTLDRPLDYYHLGEGDYRGEVANLSRNVVIESAEPAKGRGHTMYHRYSAGAISYAEFRHLGKEGVLGKYPIHIHLAGDTMRGSYVLGASIWDSGNRWVTVHGTNYFIVRDCVGYQSVGHGFYLEDGTEVFNVLDRNLGVQAFAGKPLPEQFLPFDHNDGAAFWWANSLNTFTRNVAVECDRYGFRFEATPTLSPGGRGQGEGAASTKGFNLRRPIQQPDGTTEPVDIRTLSFVRFDGNEAHDHLFGINLGGLGGNFFATGVDSVVPDHGSPFLVQNTRIWNTHWAFAPHTRYAVNNLDIAESTYGLFLPAFDAEVLPPRGSQRRDAMPNWGLLTFRRTQVPVRLPDTPPKYFGQAFDLMEFAGDTLPPATVITHIHRTKDGALRVRGTTSENEFVKSVLVNGRTAKATAPNFAEWEITLDDLPPGDVKLTAHAIDESGNIEPRPHVVLVPASGNRKEASVLLDKETRRQGDKEKLGDRQRVAGAERDDRWLAVAHSQLRADKENPDIETLQGTWQVVCQQRGGRATARPKGMLWVVEGETIWLVPGWLAERTRQERHEIKKPAEGRRGSTAGSGDPRPAPGQAGKDEKPPEKPQAAIGKKKIDGGDGRKSSGDGRKYIGPGLRMTFRLDAAKSPKQIDIDGPMKGMHLGLYQLDGDELTMCIGISRQSPKYGGQANGDDNTRPTTISPENGTVIVLKRAKTPTEETTNNTNKHE